MEKNPFEASLIKDFFIEDPCEDLDVFMRDLQLTNKYASYFNPWHHRLINWFVSKLTPTPRRVIYDEDYIGSDRRKAGRIRKLVESRVAAVKVMLMTRTQKILIEE